MIKLSGSDLPTDCNQLSSPPKQLWVEGDLKSLLSRPRLSVVGSRHATAYGRQVTTKLVSQLASKGVVIVSGLAYGIDTVAHLACLKAGGQTIAVLPSSLHKIYPSGHELIAKEIIKSGGVLVSEYPKNSETYPANFIARNRIVAALGEGILVTEAAINSGSMHTVRFGLELGRAILSVPGNINNPISAGCNNLIKSGAQVVTGIDDIINALNWQLDVSQPSALGANQPEQIILELLQKGVTEANEMLLKSGLAIAEFNQHLTMLEITARIRPLGANQWTLVNP